MIVSNKCSHSCSVVPKDDQTKSDRMRDENLKFPEKSKTKENIPVVKENKQVKSDGNRNFFNCISIN